MWCSLNRVNQLAGMDSVIAGVGDEVVLFAGFLVFSLLFLTVFSVWKKPGTPAAPPAAPPTEEEESYARQNQNRSPDSHNLQDGTEHPEGVVTGTEESGLRRRYHTSADHSREAESTSSESPSSGRGTSADRSREAESTSESVPDPQPSSGHGTSAGDDEINVRLIQAGGPGHTQEVRVTPGTTLQELRR